MGALGCGNGAVFQLVGMRFRERIGVMTGLVGAAGGLGGFLLPTLLGTAKDELGSYGAGLGILAAVGAVALVGTLALRGVWKHVGVAEVQA
jgi:NNP family nitrate/nitrite transporter-like MFS transporter